MTARHLVDPQLLPLLEAFPTLRLSAETLPMLRDLAAQRLSRLQSASDPEIAVSEAWIAGSAGAADVRARICAPAGEGAARPAFLHMHGGGYVSGAADLSTPRNAVLVKEIGCVVVSVDYRLAPETAHPGPLEDCYAALKWLHANAARLGVDGNRIAIGGESAGGGLAAALALLARDRGEVPVAFQALLSPMLDDRTGSTVAADPHASGFIWTPESNRFGWRALLGCEPGGADTPAYAAAARAQNLAGLPPAYISTSALDMFCEENLEYARRLIRAGVPAELRVYPGAFHGFELAADADVSKRALRDLVNALKRGVRAQA